MSSGAPTVGSAAIEAVIFDFDGVLVESVDVKTKAFAEVFAPYGDDAVRTMIDFHLANGGISRFEKFRHFYSNVLGRAITDADMEALCDQFASLVVREVVAAPWVAGAKAWLDQHHALLDLFVISGTPQDELLSIIELRGMGGYFKAVYGAPKDKGEAALEIRDASGLSEDAIAFVGDALTDLEAARATGLRFIGRVPDPMAGTHIFTNHQVPTIKDLSELSGALGLDL